MKEAILTQEYLKSILHYDENSGVFTNLVKRGHKTFKGAIAGSFTSAGYAQIKINYKNYTAHRLVWLYVYGYFPPNQVDHINGIKSDNRLSNLRLANMQENKRNQGLTKANKTGKKGVHLMPSGKWKANCRINNKTVHIGHYNTMEEAATAYDTFVKIAHGDFYFNSTGC